MPLIVVTGRDSVTIPLVAAGTSGIAANHTPGGDAISAKYGVAMTTSGGTANAGANGVALAHSGGEAITGDEGVSVVKKGGRASCNNFGVAYSSSSTSTCGLVSGGIGAVLVLVWKSGNKANSVCARVGDVIDGVTIQPGAWYTYNVASRQFVRVQKVPSRSRVRKKTAAAKD